NAETKLPGLAPWGRVRDYRVYQIQQMANVEVFPASRLTAEQVLEFGADHIAIATGSHWRKDGYGRIHQFPIPGLSDAQVLTPDDVMAGVVPAGPVIVYDDDHYYMGGIVAEKLRGDGLDVTLVTSDPVVSSWTSINLEQHRIQAHVLGLGIEVLANHKLHRVAGQAVELACVFSERVTTLEAASIVMVTSRLPDAALFDELDADQARLKEAGSPSLRRIGDCYGPATIAAAVYEGHRFARELGTEPEDIPYKRELTELADEFALP
ncbi:MAG: NADH:flavin oxidoreductase, partial [Rhodospirillaceae bacterium]|nr:NADH:flavin oxidoreductase [Rhodospirillaceae bacterium]